MMVGGVYWEGEEKMALVVVVVVLLLLVEVEFVEGEEGGAATRVCFTGRVMARDCVEGGKGRGIPPALLREGVVKVRVSG